MTIEQAMIDETNITSIERSVLTKYEMHDSEHVQKEINNDRSDTTLVRCCVDNLSQPPPNY